MKTMEFLMQIKTQLKHYKQQDYKDGTVQFVHVLTVLVFIFSVTLH